MSYMKFIIIISFFFRFLPKRFLAFDFIAFKFLNILSRPAVCASDEQDVDKYLKLVISAHAAGLERMFKHLKAMKSKLS